MNEQIKGRSVIDVIDRVQIQLTASGQASQPVNWQPKRTGMAALIQPIVSVFNSSGVLIPTLQARHKYGLTISKDSSETQVIPNSVDFGLLNTYYMSENAKPLAISSEDKLVFIANHDSSLGTGTFSNATVEVMLIVTYITEQEYLELSRSTK